MVKIKVYSIGFTERDTNLVVFAAGAAPGSRGHVNVRAIPGQREVRRVWEVRAGAIGLGVPEVRLWSERGRKWSIRWPEEEDVI